MASVNFNLQGEARKELANEIGAIMGITPVYAGPGGKYRYSFVIMDITVTKEGEVIWDERTDKNTINKVFDGLERRGYEFERPLTEEQIAEFSAEISEEAGGDPRFAEAQRLLEIELAKNNENAPDTITIEIPFTSCGDLTKEKETLRDLINSKATLIKAALGEDGTGELPIEFADGNSRSAHTL